MLRRVRCELTSLWVLEQAHPSPDGSNTVDISMLFCVSKYVVRQEIKGHRNRFEAWVEIFQETVEFSDELKSLFILRLRACCAEFSLNKNIVQLILAVSGAFIKLGESVAGLL